MTATQRRPRPSPTLPLALARYGQRRPPGVTFLRRSCGDAPPPLSTLEDLMGFCPGVTIALHLRRLCSRPFLPPLQKVLPLVRREAAAPPLPPPTCSRRLILRLRCRLHVASDTVVALLRRILEEGGREYPLFKTGEIVAKELRAIRIAAAWPGGKAAGRRGGGNATRVAPLSAGLFCGCLLFRRCCRADVLVAGASDAGGQP